MKIAVFDIDDTIVDETKFMKENAPEFIKNTYGIDVFEVNPNGYDVKEVYDLKNYFLNQGYSEDYAIEKSDQINKKFWNKNFVKYCMQPVKSGVKDTIDHLRKNGYKIHFVSLRGKPTTGKVGSLKGDFIRLGVVPLLTKFQLAKSGLKYDVLRLVKSNEEKVNYINSMSPDFIFEDQPSVISEITSQSKIFCVATPHNRISLLGDEIIRISNIDLSEIKSHISETIENGDVAKKNVLVNNVVTNMCITNPTYLRKILTESTYTIVKTIGTPIFLTKYKPIIKGAENIPKKGAVAFVGNHRNKLDPVLITASQKRKVHWGALLRMFQGKENLFSSGKNPIPCYLSAAFITAMGAVPIARKDDENYMDINLKSIQMMYQMLSWNGAVGLFPEGTLNRNPEEQNILQLKSNRVFRLVKDNEGLIQPFSIVWLPKDLEVENRVIINYGIPINTRNRSVKEIATMWDDVVEFDIELSKKLIEDIKTISNNSCDNEKQKQLKLLIKQFKDR